MLSRLRAGIIILLALGVLAGPSGARGADAGTPLYGTWIDQRERGGMQIAFTPTTMEFASLDAAGRQSGAVQVAQVKYGTAKGAITVAGPHGQGMFMVEVEGKDTILVDVPGLMATHYRRKMD